MPDGKGGNEDDHFFPVLHQVAEAEGGHEEDVIQRFRVEDVLYADPEVESEVFHAIKAEIVKLFRLLYHRNLLFKWLHVYINGWER
jgi:hypothetical protein